MRMKHIAAVAAIILLFAAAEGQTPATMPSISFNPGAATAPADTNADKAATPEKLTATKAFAEAPAKVFPTLDRMTRLRRSARHRGVKFYTTRWKEIDKGLFIVPLLDDWIKPEGKGRKADLENAVPFMLARFSYAPETGTMALTNNLGGFLPEEDTAWAGGLLRSKLVYKWNGKKMVKVKE